MSALGLLIAQAGAAASSAPTNSACAPDCGSPEELVLAFLVLLTVLLGLRAITKRIERGRSVAEGWADPAGGGPTGSDTAP